MKHKYKKEIKHVKKKFGVSIYEIEKEDWTEDSVHPLSKRKIKICKSMSSLFDVKETESLHALTKRNYGDLMSIAKISFRKNLIKTDYRTFNKVPMNIYS